MKIKYLIIIMVPTIAILLVLLCVINVFAQGHKSFAQNLKMGNEVPIWDDVAPGSEEWKIPESVQVDPDGVKNIANVVRPTLTAFFPDHQKATGTAVIFCAGGGFRSLPDPSMLNDNINNPKWLINGGLTVFVLKYRLMQGTPEELAYREKLQTGNLTPDKINEDLASHYMRPIRNIAADDGRQAVKLLRMHAMELGIAPDRIGIIGMSSGAVLSATVGAEHDADSCPDFIGVFWGAPPDTFVQISKGAPPIFIVSSVDDLLTWEGSIRLYDQWRKANHSAELHVYGHGGHMGRNGKDPSKASDGRAKQDFFTWLKVENLIN